MPIFGLNSILSCSVSLAPGRLENEAVFFRAESWREFSCLYIQAEPRIRQITTPLNPCLVIFLVRWLDLAGVAESSEDWIKFPPVVLSLL